MARGKTSSGNALTIVPVPGMPGIAPVAVLPLPEIAPAPLAPYRERAKANQRGLQLARERAAEAITKKAILPATPTPKCATCKDSGFVRRDVPVGHEDFGRIVPCADCNTQAERQARGIAHMNTLPEILAQREARWSTFPKQMDRAAVQTAIENVEYIRNGMTGDRRAVMFAGLNQIGKSGLAYCMWAALSQGRTTQTWEPRIKPVPAAFITAAALLMRFNEAKMTVKREDGDSPAYSDLMNRFARVPVLVLDDLGSEHQTDSRIESLFTLLDRRLLNPKCFTIITTNLKIDTTNPDVTKRCNEVLALFGARIWSRMIGGRMLYLPVKGAFGNLVNPPDGA